MKEFQFRLCEWYTPTSLGCGITFSCNGLMVVFGVLCSVHRECRTYQVVAHFVWAIKLIVHEGAPPLMVTVYRDLQMANNIIMFL